jgi:hypothetical protein
VNEQSPENDSPVKKAAQRVIAAIDAVQLDPKQMVRTAVARVTALKYPTATREAQAVILIGSIEHQARELVWQFNLPSLRTLLYKFECDAMALVQPLPQPTWDEHIAGWCKLGWTAKELDMDRMWLHVDGGRNTKERIVSITENSLTLTSGKTLTREQLGLRPYAPVAQPTVVIAGASAGGPSAVYSDRPVVDTTAGGKAD